MTFRLERWAEFWADAEPLINKHWEEIALHKDKIPLGFDVAKYQALEDSNLFYVMAVRDEQMVLVGYFLIFLMPHLHYMNAGPMAFTDIYWMEPSQRLGNAGIRLFIEAEKTMRELGAVKGYISCKAAHDKTRIFEALGWSLSDYSFTKMFI